MHPHCVRTINEECRLNSLDEFVRSGFSRHDESWIRGLIRMGAKAPKSWCRNGCYWFRYLRRNTYQWGTLNGHSGVIQGETGPDCYARLTEAIENAICNGSPAHP